ncbi:MAG: proteasome accessory factor PafA2 family protein, partial [Armatimonadota bacterium]
MAPILSGIETEYGFTIEGRGAEDQIDDAISFVRGYTGPHLAAWDYRHESPRSDLRGFAVQHLAVDPEDAQFDRHDERPSHDIRSDRILPNGARFYNDHGHPEYSTPECWSLSELALHDLAGERVLV